MTGMDDPLKPIRDAGVTAEEFAARVKRNALALAETMGMVSLRWMTGMDDLVTWLRAQWEAREQELDEDERVARNASWAGRWVRESLSSVVDATDGDVIVYGDGRPTAAQAHHIARHDPARVLREVAEARADIAAKRRILDGFVEDMAMRAPSPEGRDWVEGYAAEASERVRLLALPMAGRDGYREEWRP